MTVLVLRSTATAWSQLSKGLFVRVETLPGSAPRTLTVPGRFDDIDIVHVIAEKHHCGWTSRWCIRGYFPTAQYWVSGALDQRAEV